MLTKEHAELPMKQAYVDELLSHDYDYQKDVYKQVREWAYKAIELLEKEDNIKRDRSKAVFRRHKVKFDKGSVDRKSVV